MKLVKPSFRSSEARPGRPSKPSPWSARERASWSSLPPVVPPEVPSRPWTNFGGAPVGLLPPPVSLSNGLELAADASARRLASSSANELERSFSEPTSSLAPSSASSGAANVTTLHSRLRVAAPDRAPRGVATARSARASRTTNPKEPARPSVARAHRIEVAAPARAHTRTDTTCMSHAVQL